MKLGSVDAEQANALRATTDSVTVDHVSRRTIEGHLLGLRLLLSLASTRWATGGGCRDSLRVERFAS